MQKRRGGKVKTLHFCAGSHPNAGLGPGFGVHDCKVFQYKMHFFTLSLPFLLKMKRKLAKQGGNGEKLKKQYFDQ